MPGGDGTGPNGLGGWCTPYFGKRKIWGAARRGLGRRKRFLMSESDHIPTVNDLQELEDEAKFLEQRLRQIHEDMKKIQKE